MTGQKVTLLHAQNALANAEFLVSSLLKSDKQLPQNFAWLLSMAEDIRRLKHEIELERNEV